MTPIWIATLCIVAQLASAKPGLGEEHCPRGQVFSPCASPCGVATCQTLETPCPDRACVPGCVCPATGQVWHRGRCVDKAVCDLRPINTNCPRGQVFSVCASPCKVPTCQTFGISCPEKRCEPGCMCPLETPVWHKGRCVAPQECREDEEEEGGGVAEENCPRGQAFSPCASPCGVATCTTLETPCPETDCVPGCVCPAPGQVWHRGRCVDEAVCDLRPINTNCPRGQVFSECASPCKVPTCQTFGISCPEQRCEPGCMCPLETPVWHKGRCVAPQECREDEEEEGGVAEENCPRGQVCSPCASPCGVATCRTLETPCPDRACVPGCVCPATGQVWHQGRCVDEAVCDLRPINTNCPRGQVFSVCASPCKVPTCQTFGISCPEKRCEPGCMCPLQTPVWHKGRCVAPQECREDEEEEGGEFGGTSVFCPEGLEYSSCASFCGVPTCETYRVPCIALCVEGCVCPNRRHVWYRNRCQDPDKVCGRGNPREIMP